MALFQNEWIGNLDSDHGSDGDWSSEEEAEVPSGSRGTARTRLSTETLVHKSRPGSSFGSPSGFAVLPMEIILEICRCLHPKDLLAFARLNKRLRSVLTSRKSSGIWRASFFKAAAPACPSDQTPMQWAQLLFETDCTFCWKKHRVRDVHWALRMRPCFSCVTTKLVGPKDVPGIFPSISRTKVYEVLELLPSSLQIWDYDRARYLYTKSSPALLDMINVLEELRAGPQGEKAVTLFKEERREESRGIEEQAGELLDWYDSYLRKRRLMHRQQLVANFIKLGYHQDDIFPVVKQSKRTGQITDSYWKSLRSKYEPMVEKEKCIRLHKERLHLLEEKQALGDRIWNDFHNQNRHDPDVITPKSFLTFPPFRNIASSTASVAEARVQFQDALTSLPGFLQEWRRERKVILLKAIAQGLHLELPELLDSSQMDLELQRYSSQARIVLICQKESCLKPLLLRDVWKHPCCLQGGQMPDSLVFDLNASRVVDEIARLLGLDRDTVTVNNLDLSNHRFFCILCRGPGRKFARSWRNCMEHIHVHKNAKNVALKLIDDSATAMVVEYENLSCKTHRIGCRLCPSNNLRYGYANFQFQKHMESRHQKAPSINDFFVDPRFPSDPTVVPSPVILKGLRRECEQRNIESHERMIKHQDKLKARAVRDRVHRCTHCKDLESVKSTRTFQPMGVFDHLKTVHNVSYPVRGRDFYI